MRRLCLVLGLAATGGAVLTAGGGGVARAEMILLLVPSVTVGITDNASAGVAGEPRVRDEFGTGSLAATARYGRARDSHALTYFLAYTRYFEGHGPDTLTNSLSLSSLFNLSGVLDLSLTASLGLSRSSRVDVSDLTVVMPQATAAGSLQFFTVSATEALVYRPTPRRTLSESLTVSQLRYLNAPAGLPTTTVVGGNLKGAMSRARDTYALELQVFDTITPDDPGLQALNTFASGHTFVGRVLASWDREISAVWSTHLDVGPMAVFKLTGPAVIAPSATAGVNYRRRPWFATAAVSQTAAPNLFFGEATINDQALVRLALPLTRDEALFATGFASYIFARVATSQGTTGRAFDQRTAGVALGVRLPRRPISAQLQYTVLDQDGGNVGGREVPDLFRQVLMLTVGGVLAWGPGTPPLFAGSL